jgi:hypothetical protein
MIATVISFLHLVAVGVLASPANPMYGYPPMPTISYHFPNTTSYPSMENTSPYSTPVYVSPIYQQPSPYPTGVQMHSNYPTPYYPSQAYPNYSSSMGYQTLPYYAPTVSYATEIPYATPSQTPQPIYQSYYPPTVPYHTMPVYTQYSSAQYMTSYYMSSYPSSYYPPTNMCPSSGVDINHVGTFALWTYAPGYCDLDNKPVSSTVSPHLYFNLTVDQLSFQRWPKTLPFHR